MASTSYFGRPEHNGRRLGADLDLIAKWSRNFKLRHPVHSFYLTQLSDDDRAKLFSGPAEEFRFEQGPDNNLKLETVKDEIDRIDLDVQTMMRSHGYVRSEARRLEVLDAIEDAQDHAQGAAALALSRALMDGMDGPPAEYLSKEVADNILDTAAYRVKAKWLAAKRDRLQEFIPEAAASPAPDKNTPHTTHAPKTTPSPVGPDFIASWHATLRERFPALAANTSIPPAPSTVGLEDTDAFELNAAARTTSLHTSQSADIASNQTTPLQKPLAKAASPNSSVPEYGSETSLDSAHWNSPGFSLGDVPSSPDVDSLVDFLDDADGGVALLSSSLADDLDFKDESNVTTPTLAANFDFSRSQDSRGHLGAGLEAAFMTIRASTTAGTANTLVSTYSVMGVAAIAKSVSTQSDHTHATGQDSTEETSSSPFSPSGKISDHPLAKEQPWMGFSCYEVPFRFGNDQLVPKYWTTRRGKERYVRYKIGQLKLDDAKLRSDRFTGAVARNPVHIFVDLSNIIIGFYDSMKESRGIPITKRVHAPAFSFRNFDTILTRDRNVAKRIVAGSMSNSYSRRRPDYMVQAEELNYEMNILERVPKPASPVRKRKTKAGGREFESATSGADTSGDDLFLGPMKHGEQGVDELLHLKMLQSMVDADPATMVLATGDAAFAQYSDGFKSNIERLLRGGWNIELYAWSRNISSAWREPEFAERWGHQFKIVELDGFCEELFDVTVESLER